MTTSAPAADPRLWIIAVAAVINLVVSTYNIIRTNRTNNEIRSNRDAMQRLEAAHKARSIRLEEFRSTVRDPVRDRLLELRELGRRIDGVAQTRSPIEDHEADIKEINEHFFSIIGSIYDTLQDANESKFADGDDWFEGVSDHEDRIADALNNAMDSSASVKSRLDALEQASEEFRGLRDTINGRVEHALHSFAEESALAPGDCASAS